MIYARRQLIFALCCSITLLVWTAAATAIASTVGSIKGTVSATTSDVSARPTLLGGARLTLVNRDLPTQQPLRLVTDETGNFIFRDLPAATYLLSAEADGFPAVTKEINLTAGATLNVEVLLTANVSASVTVRVCANAVTAPNNKQTRVFI